MRYHTKFKNFKPDALKATRLLFSQKPWRGTTSEKLAKYRYWLADMSQIYGVCTPTLKVLECSHVGSGYYSPLTQEIVLPKFSVTTLFHEFRHHLQAHGIGQEGEDDARGWSLSLFYTLKPTKFKQLVKDRKIGFVTTQDLKEEKK